ncbi:hypothetical protein QE152_g10606 [Popillia japonica]|uniref:Uncharacterized protein n=1 Tax=Popillia japonica TaxID=7064 RepID=A0AAW1LUW5_POPJA
MNLFFFGICIMIYYIEHKDATGNYERDQKILMRMWEELENEPDIENNEDNESLADDFLETIDANTDSEEDFDDEHGTSETTKTR